MVRIDGFFFQAEDGIRDLVRSRGLGDVYKRQVRIAVYGRRTVDDDCLSPNVPVREIMPQLMTSKAVSYTHLTLPTSDLV